MTMYTCTRSTSLVCILTARPFSTVTLQRTKNPPEVPLHDGSFFLEGGGWMGGGCKSKHCFLNPEFQTYCLCPRKYNIMGALIGEKLPASTVGKHVTKHALTVPGTIAGF